jgi:hypothetical protein
MRVDDAPAILGQAVNLTTIPCELVISGRGNEIECQHSHFTRFLHPRIENLDSIDPHFSTKRFVVLRSRFQPIDAAFRERIEISHMLVRDLIAFAPPLKRGSFHSRYRRGGICSVFHHRCTHA